MEKAKFNKETAKKIAVISVNVLVCLILVMSLFITILVFSAQGSEDGVPAIFGKSLITIESGSMEPTYNEGDLVFMTKLSSEEKMNLEPGQIITYRAPIDINRDGMIGDINTHRIVSIDKDSLRIQTKGDNPETNTADDNYTIHLTDVIGVCTEDGKIGGLGSVIGFLRSSLGFFLCIVLPLILFFLYELYRFIMLVVSERAKRAPVSKETEDEIKKRAIEEYIKSQAAAQSAEAKPREEAKPTEEAKPREETKPAEEAKPAE